MARVGRFPRRSGVAVAAWLSLCAGAAAQVPDPLTTNQLVRVFDFEEPGNPDPVPERWFRAQDDPAGVRRAGFPAFNRAEFDGSQAVSGKRSVRLPTRGGSTCLRLTPGELAVFPDADYGVSAMVKTTELKQARAFIVVRLLDQQLNIIPGSEVRSAPVLSTGVWTQARVHVPGRFPAAAWLQVDLEVLQPKEFEAAREDDPLGKFRVWREDVEGAAWFDDVSIALLPRTRFAAVSPTGVVQPGGSPALELQVRDLGGRDLSGVVRVVDVDGREVWRREMPLEPDNRVERIVPVLPGFGWYRAVLEVSSNGEPVSHHEAELLSIPARVEQPGVGAVGDWERVGIVADRLPEAALPALPAALKAAGARLVVLAAADPSVDAAGARAALDARLPTLTALLSAGQQVTLAVTGVPSRMAAERLIDPGDVGAMCERDPEALLKLLEPTLDVLGQRIGRYQLGGTWSDGAVRKDASAAASALERVIARLAPGPSIGLAWRADCSLPAVRRVDPPAAGGSSVDLANVAPGPLLDALSVRYPLGFPAWGLETLASRSAAEGPGVELTIVPELPDAARFGERARAVEAGRRIVEFWRCFGETPAGRAPARLALDHPWSIGGDDRGARLGPAVELAVLAGVMDRLDGRRMIGPVPAPPGVRAYLFASRRGDQFSRGVVAAWNESAAPADAELELMRTGQALEVYDCFGNRIAGGSETPGTSGGGLVKVSLGESPVFIEHVDPYLTMFAASLHLEPTFVPAVVSEHEHRVSIRNPWPIRLTGRLQIKQNEGDQTVKARSGDWTITPSVTDFVVGPGETASIPVTLSFGPGQLAGTKDLWLVARAVADRAYPAVRVKTTLEVGLPDIELVPEVQLSSDGQDVQVVAIVTNKDSRPRSLRVDTAARNVASQQAQVSDLPPGQTVNKRFVFRGAAKTLSGQRIVVTLSDSEGASRLNRAVVVP